jgi:hypothetical protein
VFADHRKKVVEVGEDFRLGNILQELQERL